MAENLRIDSKPTARTILTKIIFAHYRELVRPGEAKKWFGILPEGYNADPQPKPQATIKAREATNVIPMGKVGA